MPAKSLFLKHSFLNIAGTFAYFFSQWITTVVVVQFLGYTAAGVYSLVVSFTNIFMFISQFGIRNFQISDVLQHYSASQYFGARAIAASLALLAFGLSLFVFRFDRTTLLICTIYIAFKMLETFTDFLFAVFQKHDLYGVIAVSYILKSVVSLGSFIAALLLWKSLLIAILLMMAAYSSVIIFYDTVIFKKWERIALSFDKAIQILISCLPLMLTTLITPYMVFIVRYIIKLLYGEEELGYFSAISMVIVVMTTLASAIWFVIVPHISRDIAEGRLAKVKNTIVIVCSGISVLGFLSIVAGSLFANKVFVFLFGESILPHLYLLTPVLITSSLLTATAFFATILIPLGSRNGILVCGIIGAVVCSIVVYPLTKEKGLFGANTSLILGVTSQLAALIMLAIFTMRRQKTT